MEQLLSDRKKYIVLIVSVILHLLFLAVLLLAAYLDQQAERNQRDQLAAEPTILSQSPINQTAQVIFQDDTPASEPLPHQDEEITKAVPDQLPETDDTKTESPEPAELQQTTAPEPLPVPQMFEHPSSPESRQFEQAPSNIPVPQKQPQRRAAPPMSIKQLTQGFLKSMAQEQGGAPKTYLDHDQLALARYGTKVWSLLRQSYNAYKAPTHLYSSMSTQGTLIITLKKDGSLANIYLQHNDKNHDLREIEQILCAAARNAGLFPPIPQHFNVDTITLQFPLGIEGKEGTHTYDLSYRA